MTPKAPTPPSGRAAEATAQQRILDTLASLDAAGCAAPAAAKVALFSYLSPSSSGFERSLRALRRDGFVEVAKPVGHIRLTSAGAAAARGPHQLSVSSVHQFVREKVGLAQSRILDVLIDAHPESVPRAELAYRAGASPGSSTFASDFATLERLSLIEVAPTAGLVKVTDALFIQAPTADAR